MLLLGLYFSEVIGRIYFSIFQINQRRHTVRWTWMILFLLCSVSLIADDTTDSTHNNKNRPPVEVSQQGITPSELKRVCSANYEFKYGPKDKLQLLQEVVNPQKNTHYMRYDSASGEMSHIVINDENKFEPVKPVSAETPAVPKPRVVAAIPKDSNARALNENEDPPTGWHKEGGPRHKEHRHMDTNPWYMVKDSHELVFWKNGDEKHGWNKADLPRVVPKGHQLVMIKGEYWSLQSLPPRPSTVALCKT